MAFRKLNRLLTAITGLALAASFTVTLAAQDSLAKFEAQYNLERDPVAKARILARLGHFAIEDARSNLKSGQEEQSLAGLEHYRDEVENTVSLLVGTGVNAEQHPAGFKELQISLRESLRRVDELITLLPFDKRPWFQTVRSDLAASQNRLIEALFPTLGNKGHRKGDRS